MIHNNEMQFKEFLELEIDKWLSSPQRKRMIEGECYFEGEHDILTRKREVIGKDGKLQSVENLPNNKIIDNQYKKMVNQKVNYLIGKPLTIKVDNKGYEKELSTIFNARFHKKLKYTCENSLNGGISWVYVFVDEKGKLAFKRFNSYECLPFWKDEEHSELDLFVRMYEIEGYEGTTPVTIEKVEVYYVDKIEFYELKDKKLIPDENETYYLQAETENEEGEKATQGYNWGKIPIIPFKYNHREMPLIKQVKCLQDAINIMKSDFQNDMQEKGGNGILIIKNYDGTDLSEFRQNLMTHRCVKVSSEGGIETLTVEVNAENYEIILQLLKKALIENAMGYDAKDDRIGSNANQMNIQSMYSDIELDANGMETEYQASFEELLELIDIYLEHKTGINYSNIEVKFIFNRDMMMNETEVIDNIRTSVGLLSQKTLIEQHPWISDVDNELQRIAEEKTNSDDPYANTFKKVVIDDEESELLA